MFMIIQFNNQIYGLQQSDIVLCITNVYGTKIPNPFHPVTCSANFYEPSLPVLLLKQWGWGAGST